MSMRRGELPRLVAFVESIESFIDIRHSLNKLCAHCIVILVLFGMKLVTSHRTCALRRPARVTEEYAPCPSARDAVLTIFEHAVGKSLGEGLPDGRAPVQASFRPPTGDPGAPETLRDIEGFLLDAVERGRASGEIPTSVDPQETPRALLALYLGLRLLASTRPEEALLRTIVRRARAMLS